MVTKSQRLELEQAILKHLRQGDWLKGLSAFADTIGVNYWVLERVLNRMAKAGLIVIDKGGRRWDKIATVAEVRKDVVQIVALDPDTLKWVKGMLDELVRLRQAVLKLESELSVLRGEKVKQQVLVDMVNGKIIEGRSD